MACSNGESITGKREHHVLDHGSEKAQGHRDKRKYFGLSKTLGVLERILGNRVRNISWVRMFGELELCLEGQKFPHPTVLKLDSID